MDFDWLLTFVAAAKTQNFRKTAQDRCLSQAAVSQHIAKLEHELGVSLFTRRGRAVHLSGAGEAYLPYAKRVLALQGAGREALHVRDWSTPVTLAAESPLAEAIVPWLAGKWSQACPEADILVRVLASEQLSEVVAGGSAPVGLRYGGSPYPGTARHRLFWDEVEMVAPSGSVPDPLALLSHFRLIVQDPLPYWPALLDALGELDCFPRSMHVNEVSVTRAMVREGLGVSFLPESAIRRDLLEGRLTTVPIPSLRLPTLPVYWLRREGTEGEPLLDVAEHILKGRWPLAFRDVGTPSAW